MYLYLYFWANFWTPACIWGPASISTIKWDPGLYSRPCLYLRIYGIPVKQHLILSLISQRMQGNEKCVHVTYLRVFLSCGVHHMQNICSLKLPFSYLWSITTKCCSQCIGSLLLNSPHSLTAISHWQIALNCLVFKKFVVLQTKTGLTDGWILFEGISLICTIPDGSLSNLLWSVHYSA